MLVRNAISSRTLLVPQRSGHHRSYYCRCRRRLVGLTAGVNVREHNFVLVNMRSPSLGTQQKYGTPRARLAAVGDEQRWGFGHSILDTWLCMKDELGVQ